jgi:thioesterase domain-containing protein
VHSDESALLAVRHYLPALGRGRAVFGLLPPRIGRHFDRTSSIEEMSLTLVDEVLRVQPAGPYLLTGHSLGGLLAYELARRLRARGHAVGFLGLADAMTPEVSMRAWREHMALRSRLRRQRDRGFLKAGTKLLEVAERELRDTLLRLGLASSALDTGQEWFDHRGAEVLGRRYHPIGQEGILVIFAAEASARATHSQTLGWDRVHRGPVHTHVLPGTHLSLLQDPHVGLLASAMAACVRDAEAAGEVNGRASAAADRSASPQS